MKWHTLRVVPYWGKKKRVFRRRESSPSLQTVRKLRPGTESTGHINADPFVSANPPSPEAIEEAVAAERREAGSGRPIIQTAANQTWKARRSA